MVLKIHNTLSGTKETFKPVDEKHVRVYACGPTVYNFAHIGNARMAVANDLLINVLRTQYKKVTYVSNITDIDDKIIDAAHELNEPIKNLTTKYTKIYNEDMGYLNVKLPDVQPRATDHINEMIDLTKKSNIEINENLQKLINQLKEINLKLWNIEEDKRKCEKNADFGKNFIQLSRNVYINNDKRARIKSDINKLLGSNIKEVKSY